MTGKVPQPKICPLTTAGNPILSRHCNPLSAWRLEEECALAVLARVAQDIRNNLEFEEMVRLHGGRG